MGQHTAMFANTIFPIRSSFASTHSIDGVVVGLHPRVYVAMARCTSINEAEKLCNVCAFALLSVVAQCVYSHVGNMHGGALHSLVSWRGHPTVYVSRKTVGIQPHLKISVYGFARV